MSAVVVGAVLLGLLGVRAVRRRVDRHVARHRRLDRTGALHRYVARPAMPVHAFWGTNAVVGTGRAAAVHLDGRDSVSQHACPSRMFRRTRAVAAAAPGRLMHVNILGCGDFRLRCRAHRQPRAQRSAKFALPELRRRGYRRADCARFARDCRHARHPDSAVDHDGRLRGGGRRVDHSRVSGRHHARACC